MNKSAKKIVCQVCKKRFATTGALAQHRRDAHQGNTGGAKAQRSKPRSAPAGLRSLVTTGSDLLATVNIRPVSAVGYRLWVLTLSPNNFLGTRLTQEAQLYARWKPASISLKIVGGGAYTTYGTITVAWDPDPTNIWSVNGGVEQLRRVMALPCSRTIRLSETAVLNVPVESSRRWYQTTGEVDQTSHGSFIAVTSSSLGGFAGSISATASLTWKMHWEGEAPPPLTSEVSDRIQPDAGWSDIFTTSDGSFDSNVLTFKMHSGGDMVPFTAARHGVVYTVDGSKVPYYDETGAEKFCTYFAKVDAYSIPGLLCFAGLTDAKDYIRNGDVTKALKYSKAGNYVTPSRPYFKAVLSATSTVGVPSDRISVLEDKLERLMALIPTESTTTLVADRLVAGEVKTVAKVMTSVLDTEHEEARLKVATQQPHGNLLDPVCVFTEIVGEHRLKKADAETSLSSSWDGAIS